jgi:integrase
MSALSNQVTISKSNHGRYKWRVRFPEAGKRKNKYFNIKADAKKFAVLARKDIANAGLMASPVSDSEKRAVDTFREHIAGVTGNRQPTLQEAVEFYIKHAKLSESSMTCQEVADKLLLRIQKEGKGKRHMDDVTSRLGRFNEQYGDWLACDVSTEVIDEFLDDMDVSNQTKLNYRNKVNQLFRFAVKLGACSENVALNAIKPKAIDSEVGILTPKQVSRLLCEANESVVAGLAIGFFAGLRESEIQKLDWSDIDLEQGHILISAKKAKSAQRRIVEISENLRAWLLPHNKPQGRVVGDIGWHWRRGKEEARDAAGIAVWPSNAARHSFASYHLAEHQDAAKTSLELGHANQRIIFEHYRALVKPKDAHTYWSIVPEKASNITDIKAS